MGNSQRDSQIYENESKVGPRLFYHQGLIIKRVAFQSTGGKMGIIH